MTTKKLRKSLNHELPEHYPFGTYTGIVLIPTKKKIFCWEN